MADIGMCATTAEVQRKAGSGASATSNVEAYINDCMEPAAAKKFETWYTRRKKDTFNKTAKEKKEFNNEG